MVSPGTTIQEQDHTLRRKGKLVAQDLIHNSVACEWKRIDDVLRDMRMSVHTPLLEITKGCVYQDVQQAVDKYPNLKVQRLEHIALHNDSICLDPLPSSLRQIARQRHVEQDMVCAVATVTDPNGRSHWLGELYFIKAPYMFHFSVKYAPEKYELAKLAHDQNMTPEQLQTAIRQFAESKTKRVDVQDQIVRAMQNPTMEPKEISLLLRNQLLQMYHDSFYEQIFK